jgi:acetyl esterase/lipase
MKGKTMKSHQVQWNHAGVLVAAGVLAFLLLLAAGISTARGEEAGPPPKKAGEPAQRERPARGRVIPDDLELLRDVEFGKGGERTLKLDILRPKKAPAEPMPVIVYIHGGAWRAGSKNDMPGLCFPLAREGYLCASVEYRLSQEAIFPAQIEDCKCAIRFLRANAKQYGVNPDRIGVWGHSAGGHLVALLGTAGDVKELEGKGGWPDQSSRVQAVVDCFGPTDFTQMGNGPQIAHNTPNSPESLLIGGPVQENKDKAAKANPITYVTKDDPPFLIMHGDKDPLVPLSQSEILSEALKKAGVDATLHVVKGGGHGFGGREIDEMTKAFFDKHLKGAAAKKE